MIILYELKQQAEPDYSQQTLYVWFSLLSFMCN